MTMPMCWPVFERAQHVRLRRSAYVVCAALFAACDDPAAVSWPVAVAAVEVSPRTAQVQPGDAVQLEAAAVDAGGGPLGPGAATWVSADDRVARVAADGWVTGVAPGSTTIRAIRNNVAGEARVVVAWTPVSRIEIVPSRIDIPWYGRGSLTAVLYDSRGNKLRARPVLWSITPAWVAVIDANGYVVGSAEGSGTITARLDQAIASASFTVVNPCSSGRLTPSSPVVTLGGPARLQAIFTDRFGNNIQPPQVTWQTANPAVAEVGQDGWVYPAATGSVTISAFCGRTTASTVVRVVR